jgi:hypothetical protein
MLRWWSSKVARFWRHVTARVSPVEEAALEHRLPPAKLALFRSMHTADQRHGLDVEAWLRAAGHTDPDLLEAGLFHDAAKGPTVGVLHRIAWALGGRYGEWVLRVTVRIPGFAAAFERLRHHPERSAELALEAGCSEATAELIRHQADPVDAEAGEALRLADEAC